MIEKTQFIALLILANAFLPAQECLLDWEFVNEKDAIKVYTRLPEDSPIKELKVEMIVQSSLGAIVALIDDMDNYPNWVYKSDGVELIEKISDTEVIYYNEIDFPWPLSNRDVVIHSTFSQNQETKVITYESKICEDDRVAIKDGTIRLMDYSSCWVITPLKNGEIEIIYRLRSNPEGYLPAWLINLAIDTGIVETMSSFRTFLSKKPYADAAFDYVVEK